MKKNTQFCDEKFIEHFIYVAPEAAIIKEATHLRYEASNNKNLEIFNFEKEGNIIGNSVFDLAEIMGWRWSKDYAQNTKDNDLKVIHTKKPSLMPREIFLNKKGFVTSLSRIKIPIFSNYHPDTVKAIFSYASDYTDSIDISTLLQLYRSLYNDERKATTKFLEYIGFNIVHSQLITARELDCLLSFSKRRNLKEVAFDLNITRRTVEAHLSNVKEKLLCSTSVNLMNLVIEKFYSRIHKP